MRTDPRRRNPTLVSRSKRFLRAATENYRRSAKSLNGLLAVIGTALGIASILFASTAATIATVLTGVLCIAALAPVLVALVKQPPGDHQIAPPDQVYEFIALPYDASSDADLKELSAFAAERFGETFPDGVDLDAVRRGCAVGLRLTTADGLNVGFVDAYHFSAEALSLWLAGGLQDAQVTTADFVPIDDVATTELALAGCTIYIDTSNPVFDHRLAHLFLAAAQEYFEARSCRFQVLHLYAAIFSEAGRRWATRLGFELHTRAEMRGPHGGRYPVYHKAVAPRSGSPQKTFTAMVKECEYRLHLRLHRQSL